MNNQENYKIKDGIKATFDNVANSYDENKQFVISAKKMVELIDIESKEPYILDLSTGTGNIAIELGKKFSRAKIFGVDISEEMLRIAKQKTQEYNVENVTYKLQDAENLDFGNVKVVCLIFP